MKHLLRLVDRWTSRELPAERPRISCMCVTRRRVPILRRAVECFRRQTYANRELVIVHEEDDTDTLDYVKQLAIDDPRVRSVLVPVHPKLSLGELRNLAVESSGGEYVCQWDDDDWYRDDRLDIQWQALARRRRKAACVLGRWTVFNAKTRNAYHSMWRPWEGTLLCERTRMKPYPSLSCAEDTPVVKALRREGALMLIDRPEVYVYVFHGENTWPEDHFDAFFRKDRWLGQEASDDISRRLRLGSDEAAAFSG